MSDNYDDIINLSRPISAKHCPMPRSARAAQFSPFAALTGHSEAIRETARLTDRKIVLDEYEKLAVNEKLQLLLTKENKDKEISLTYFLLDNNKDGGKYITAVGKIKKIEEFRIVLVDGTSIPIDDILTIE